MDLTDIKKMVYKKWDTEIKGSASLPLPPEARYITGDKDADAYLHYLESEAGLELKVTNDRTIGGFSILDEQKFLMFALRWA